MIIQEQIGNDLVKTYSDKGMMIRKIGNVLTQEEF